MILPILSPGPWERIPVRNGTFLSVGRKYSRSGEHGPASAGGAAVLRERSWESCIEGTGIGPLSHRGCVRVIKCLLIVSDGGKWRSRRRHFESHRMLNGPMTDHRHAWVTSTAPIPAAMVRTLLLVAGFLVAHTGGLEGQSLRGSARSVDHQFRVAQDHDFTFIKNPAQVERFVEAGYLVRVRSNRNFELHAVSYPFARPETRTFILRLSEQYRRACGEKLVVTSLTRPLSRQPWNASSRSVHPTGMAVDIRRSNSRACRSWLERVLISLEKTGVLEATREYRPPHYHVALFPKPYARYVERLARQADTRIASVDVLDYRVRRGDSLWDIARSHGTTVDRLKEANDLRGSQIYAGQTIRVPLGR